jgi:putative acetyltransferase
MPPNRADVRIADYHPRWRADFARLNTEWLERWFVVEPVDRAVLSDPETHILAGGGRGIGRLLMAGALDAWRGLGGRELFLESSSRLRPALALYESVGFRHRPAPRPGSHYARADVYMVYEPDAD